MALHLQLISAVNCLAGEGSSQMFEVIDNIN